MVTADVRIANPQLKAVGLQIRRNENKKRGALRRPSNYNQHEALFYDNLLRCAVRHLNDVHALGRL